MRFKKFLLWANVVSAILNGFPLIMGTSVAPMLATVALVFNILAIWSLRKQING